MGRGEEFVLDTTLSVSDTALEGDRDLKAGVHYTLCTQKLYHHRGDKNRGTAAPVRAMKAYTESGGTTPLILNLSIKWKRYQIHAPAALPSRIYPCTYSIEGWMGARAGTNVLEQT